MKIRSFFIYTIFLQTISIVMLWGVWLAWIEFDYLADFETIYNKQQEIIAEGFANTLEPLSARDMVESRDRITDTRQQPDRKSGSRQAEK